MSKIKVNIVPVEGDGLEHRPHLNINGQAITLEFGKDVEIEEDIVAAAEASDRFIVRRISKGSPAAKQAGKGDGAAAQQGGSAAGGADTAQNSDAPDRSTTEIVDADGSEDAQPAASDPAINATDATPADLTKLQASDDKADAPAKAPAKKAAAKKVPAKKKGS